MNVGHIYYGVEIKEPFEDTPSFTFVAIVENDGCQTRSELRRRGRYSEQEGRFGILTLAFIPGIDRFNNRFKFVQSEDE
jgi:hypothetical protein